VLPELKNIEKQQAIDWANDYGCKFCDLDILIQGINEIFTHTDKIAMQQLANKLSEILERHLKPQS
jgi:hypothetical protein